MTAQGIPVPVKPFKLTKKHQREKIKNAIILLNDIVKIKLAPSSVHGVGVFAMRNIKKGDKLQADSIPHAFDVPYKEFKKLDQEVREMILGHWPQIINGSHFLYPVTKMTAFMNHSNEPNYDAKEDKVLRSIKKDEEILENYKLVPNWEKIFPWLVDKE